MYLPAPPSIVTWGGPATAVEDDGVAPIVDGHAEGCRHTGDGLDCEKVSVGVRIRISQHGEHSSLFRCN